MGRRIADVIPKQALNRVVEDFSFDAYCDAPAMNASTMKRAMHRGRTTARKIRWHYENPPTFTRAQQDSLDFGTLLHWMLFEPERVGTAIEYTGGKRDDRVKKWQEFQEEHADKLILKQGTLEHARVVMDAVMAMPDWKTLAPYIAEGQAEVSMFADMDGVQWKGRADWISTSKRALVDLKTTAVEDPEDYSYHSWKMHYHVQLGLYRDWLNRANLGIQETLQAVIVTTPPYDLFIRPMPIADLELGYDLAATTNKQLLHAIQNDAWYEREVGETVALILPACALPDEVELEAF